MPEKRAHKVCKSCGQPSETVVCVQCFLSYDTHKFKEQTDEFEFREVKLKRKDQSFVSEWEQLSNLIEPSNDNFPNEEPREQPAEENKDKHTQPLISWFSRLPRF